MIAVTGVWGLHGRQQRVENAFRFLRELQVPCLTVEMAFDDEPHCMVDGRRFQSMHHVLHLRGTRAKNDMFQKEALVNYALRSGLCDTADVICWVDADVVFLNPDWPAQARRELEHFPVCQLFGTTRYMDRHHNLGGEIVAAAQRWSTRDLLFDDYSQSHPGLAWAARGDWLRKHGLYDRMVGGSNDTVMWKAFTGMARLRQQDRMSAAFRQHSLEWCQRVGGTVEGRVGFVDGCLVHLHHGDLRARDYEARWDLPWYDPYRDLLTQGDGPLAWASESAAKKFRTAGLLLRDS